MLAFPCTKNMPITVCVYILSAHSVFRVYEYTVWYGSGLGCVCISYEPLNAGNNQLMIVCEFSYTKTCSFRRSQTRMHECFCGSKWSIRNSFPSSLTCLYPRCKSRLNVILDPATEHCRQRCDRNRMHAFLFREACMLIMIRKHQTRAYLTRWWNLFYFDGPHL